METIDVQNMINEGLLSPSKALTEEKAKKIFQQFDIPVVAEECEIDEKKIIAAALKIGFPIVLKGIGDSILHKTESGLVRVGLNTESQVKDAVDRMKETGADDIDAFLIQPMIMGQRQFVAGMFKDPQFGPVILFGIGGVLTEAIKDVVFKIAPLNDGDMDDMFDQIKAKKLFDDFRGEKAVDKTALKTILKALSDIAVTYPDIREIDVNPLIIQPDGSPVAVDGLIVLEKAEKEMEQKYDIDLRALSACYYPESIVFVGASATFGKWGNMLLNSTQAGEFKGKIYFVNPGGGEINGQRVYKSVTDIEDDVELAVITIPAGLVESVIPDLEKKNVKGILLISSGFREVGPEGEALEKRVVQKARDAGMLILGPNTMGICNPHFDFFCNASHVFPLKGSTVLVSQSGNMGTQLLSFATQQDIGIRAFSGSGNEAMVTIEDYMDAFEVDDLTRTVVLYIESVKDGPRFFKSAARVSRKKPVVVLKGGRSRMGEKAASSHTGAMASDIKVFDAACRQAGIIQVRQPMELLDLSAVFSSLPLPKGNRVAIMTLGGGWGVVTTDLCAEFGLEIPELPQEIIERLDKILPSFWSRANPVDIVGQKDPEIPKICLEELLKWEGCDAVLHLGLHGRRIGANRMIRSMNKNNSGLEGETLQMMKEAVLKMEEDYTRYVVEMTQAYQKPVLGVSLLTDSISRTLYRQEGTDYKGVFFPSPERAVKALSGMCRYNEWKKRQS